VVSQSPEDLDARVLILAPAGRDATLAAATLGQARMASHICADAEELSREILRGSGALLVTEEALSPVVPVSLAAAMGSQPTWSDLPVVIFTARRPSDALARRSLERFTALGDFRALERPVHPAMLVNAMTGALRARRRQYEARRVLLELESGVRQRDHFLAMLGHELRNPLGAIANAMRMIDRLSPPDRRVRRSLAIVDRQARHLTHLVDDLLDVGRITSGKVVLHQQPLDLVRLIEGCVEQLRPAFEQAGLDLALAPAPGAVHVRGDSVRLEQVFANLLTNALKFTPSGGRVRVGLEADAASVTVKVADTGVGIAREALLDIFELFSQAAPSLDRSKGGLGIGLTLVRALVEMHDGQVAVASHGAGHGSEFSIRLPLTTEALPERGPARSDARPACERHILLVEDSADNRESLRELLEELGHRVDVAVDGPQGVDQALRLRPEVVVVDIGLPGLDGLEVARRLRSALGTEVLLVALSGYGQPEDKERARRAGFDAHLTKPMELTALEQLLVAAPERTRARPLGARGGPH
jgi:signal transduction histidine kinase/CheY-like chemotaxis protein